ncbi:MAG: hypothetical protein QW597_02235 [Thermoplasmataceae archaeon]
MGRTTLTARQDTRRIVDQVRKMETVMRREDCAILERILILGQAHTPEVSASTLDSFSGFLISIIMELSKKIFALEKRQEQDDL